MKRLRCGSYIVNDPKDLAAAAKHFWGANVLSEDEPGGKPITHWPAVVHFGGHPTTTYDPTYSWRSLATYRRNLQDQLIETY